MWTCSSGVADDCVGDDLFDPPHRTDEGAICTACAHVLDIPTSQSMPGKELDFRNGTPVEATPTDDQHDDDEDDVEEADEE